MTQPRDIAGINTGSSGTSSTHAGPAGIDGPGEAEFDEVVLLARMDRGEANRRILARTEFIADFRRVESASLKFKVSLGSAEGKRALHRYFYGFQANLYVVSSIGRLKLAPAAVEQVEQAMRSRLDSAAKTLDRAIDDAERLFKKHAIETPATFDALPLEVSVGVIDSLGRRYLELIQKLDQLMPLLQTLEIWEVVRQRDVDYQRARMKRLVRDLASTARAFAIATRRRSSEVDAQRAAQAVKMAAKSVVADPPIAADSPSAHETPMADRSDAAAAIAEQIDGQIDGNVDAQTNARIDGKVEAESPVVDEAAASPEAQPAI